MGRPRNIPIDKEYIELLCKHIDKTVYDVAEECGLYSHDMDNFRKAYNEKAALSFGSIKKIVEHFNRELKKKDYPGTVIFEDLVAGSHCPGVFETTKEIDNDINRKAVNAIHERRFSALSTLCAPEDSANTEASKEMIAFDDLTDNQKEIIVESVRSYIASQSPVWKKVFAGSAPVLHKNV